MTISNTRILLYTLLVTGVLLGLGDFIIGGSMGGPLAQACRDCPFPIHTADNKWLMPNGKIEVEIHEEKFNEDSNTVYIWLRDPKTTDVLASGRTIRLLSVSNFLIELNDRGNTAVHGQINYVNPKSGIIQAKFTCATVCTIQDHLD